MVMVCHPGRQHSHQLAMALAEEGMLAEYLTGVPACAEALPTWQRVLLRKSLQSYAVPLAPPKVRHSFVSPIVRRVASRTLSPASAVDWAHRGDAWFDRVASRRLQRVRPDLVVCYENAALATFRVAKRLGITTVLDAASFHHSWQDRFYQFRESPRSHDRITKRKDSEAAIADAILTVSELARESYLEGGMFSHKVEAIPVGVDTAAFRPSNGRNKGPLRFVFVGNHTNIKGIDTLLDAADKLASDHVSFSLTTIGGGRGQELPTRSYLNQRCRLSHAELASELPAHDVFVLPSRFDSFGMVVVEAMACGLPVIVSENVGAREAVAIHESGLVVPPADPLRLAGAMKWFVNHLDHLPAMSAAARSMAERFDWSFYRDRSVRFLQSLAATRRDAS